MINIGIIGAGYWGKNLIRNFGNLENVSIKYFCDKNKDMFKDIKDQEIKIVSDYQEILTDDSVNAVIIATNIPSHYKLTKDSLLAGKDVFVEKPLAIKQKEAEELFDLAKAKKLILFVDYTLLYLSPVKKMKEIIEQDQIGKVYLLKIDRLNHPRAGQGQDAVIDLLPHDISVLYFLFKSFPDKVLAIGSNEHIVIFLRYSSYIVNIELSRISYKRERAYYVYGEKGMVIWDGLKSENNLKLIDDLYKETVYSEIDLNEPLAKVCQDFAERCMDRNYLDSELSIQISKIFKAIDKSREKEMWVKV